MLSARTSLVWRRRDSVTNPLRGYGADIHGIVMGNDVDGVWMSYGELAKARQISRASAMKLALRRKWQRRTDNRGTTQVYVPHLATEPAPTSEGHARDRALDMLQEQLTRERDRADRAEAQSSELRASLIRAELAAAASAESLRQAEAREAARRGQGRWARLRAAWRGWA